MNSQVTSPAPRPRPIATVGRPLDDGWRQWVAENRLRGCTPESMLVTMTTSGLDAQASLRALNELERDPVYLAALRHQQLLRKLESTVANLQKLWQSAPDYARWKSANSCRATSSSIATFVAAGRWSSPGWRATGRR